MKKLLTFTMLVAVSLGALAAPPVNEIVEKANQASYYAGQDGKARVKMDIKSADGDVRNREFVILRMNTENGNQKFYVYFEEPADVRKMAYLVWKQAGSDDDRWLWLPALNLAKRIAPGDKRTSFVGSDYVYEDVSGRGPHEDDHELLDEKDGMFHLRNTPKDKDSVEFAYYDLWIDQKTFLPMKAEYFDQDGKKYRVVEALAVETIDGFPTVVKSQVSDLNNGGTTLMTFSEIAYNIGLKENIFTERFLRRPPREVR